MDRAFQQNQLVAGDTGLFLGVPLEFYGRDAMTFETCVETIFRDIQEMTISMVADALTLQYLYGATQIP